MSETTDGKPQPFKGRKISADEITLAQMIAVLKKPDPSPPPHVARMIEEREQVQARLDKLREFMRDNPLFQTLGIIDRDLMKEQEQVMDSYVVILGMRINQATR